MNQDVFGDVTQLGYLVEDIDTAALSFTEPAGLLPSNFAKKILLRLALLFPGIEHNCTNGVFPTTCNNVSYILSPK